MNIEVQTDSYTASSNGPTNSVGNAPSTGSSQFFTYPELTQCLDLIGNLTENTKLIPLIKGQEGSGKTTLLFQLQSQIPEHWMLCRIDAHPMMHPEQFYSLLAQHFGIAEKNDLIKQELLNHFESLQHNGVLPVIAVDDAHLLPIDTVAELLQLHITSTTKEQHLLHLILFAAPTIDDILQTHEAHTIATQVIQTLDIPPLTPEQTAAYITQMLLVRGALEAFALTTDQIDKITCSSRGLPGQIENFLTKLPAHPTTPQNPTERSALKLLMEDLPVTAIASALGLISIILILLIFQDEINTLFYKTSSSENQTDSTIIKNKSEIILKLPSLPESKVAPKKALELPPQVTPVEELEPMETAIATAPQANETETKPKIEKQAPPVLMVDIAKIAEAPVPAKLSAVAPEVTQPAIALVKPITVSKPVVPKVAAKLPAAPKVKTVSKPKAVKKEPRQEAWLLSQKPTAYTLQIIALTDKSNIPAYIKQHKLTGKIAYFKTSRNGQPWYPLLYGIYPNRDTAIAARPKLASQLQQKGIWTRTLESVQKEIKAEK